MPWDTWHEASINNEDYLNWNKEELKNFTLASVDIYNSMMEFLQQNPSPQTAQIDTSLIDPEFIWLPEYDLESTSLD